MAPAGNPWTPPVLFRFSVDFQWGRSKASASFAEVDGLGQELVLDTAAAKFERAPGYPQSVRAEELVLKRALEPLNERITAWLKACFDFRETGWIEPCTVIVTLLDESGRATARWVAVRTIPTKWRAGGFSATESKLAAETITLRPAKLIRNL